MDKSVNFPNCKISKITKLYVFWVFLEFKKNGKLKNKFKNGKIE